MLLSQNQSSVNVKTHAQTERIVSESDSAEKLRAWEALATWLAA